MDSTSVRLVDQQIPRQLRPKMDPLRKLGIPNNADNGDNNAAANSKADGTLLAVKSKGIAWLQSIQPE